MSLLEWLKIWSKFYSLPLFCNTEYPPPKKMKIVRNLGTLTFQLQNTPPPENENCQKSWHFDFSVADYPPPPEIWNLGRSWHFVIFQLQITPPPRKLKFRQILVLCDFSVADYPPPPRKLKFRQILALCDFSVADYPPPEIWNLGRSWHFVIFQLQITPPKNWNLGRSWHFVIFQLQITPPPRKLKFRQILALCDFFSCRLPPPRNLKFRQILALCDFSVADYPPPLKIEI